MDDQRDYEEEAANQRDMARELAEELAAQEARELAEELAAQEAREVVADGLLAAAAAANDTTPMARWAVLTELAMVAALEQLPAPGMVSFQGDDAEGARPIIGLTFDTPEHQAGWARWFGLIWTWQGGFMDYTDAAGHHSVRWRGWLLQLSAPPASLYEQQSIGSNRVPVQARS